MKKLPKHTKSLGFVFDFVFNYFAFHRFNWSGRGEAEKADGDEDGEDVMDNGSHFWVKVVASDWKLKSKKRNGLNKN